jgi:hypothetical protein
VPRPPSNHEGNLQAGNGLRLYDAGGDRENGSRPWPGTYTYGVARDGVPTLSIKIGDGERQTRARLDTDLAPRDAEGRAISRN